MRTPEIVNVAHAKAHLSESWPEWVGHLEAGLIK